ncbi:GEVED domain-containing protein [Hymenobacter endophyticus]|uniref:GEVED domain-containing protein n=1 Tax=Hymenobacter endophyticus TaxID=3076335 RepID=A0ABU3TNH3_9BACT|nr:GEVED domain-containing protein [Hymenobacter endophyticus]MDU0372867.1 GEVED domain-containing protein [Hymenobacter endophyticus]
MMQPLRTQLGEKMRYVSGLLSLLLPLLALQARAQTCPPAAAACPPGNAPAANYPFAMGILNVTLGGINSTTAGVQEGYKNYACTLGAAALTVGIDAPISIRTNSNADENVRVWADLNNDGTFSPSSELVFSSNAKRVHTGTVRLPAGTVTGVGLRLRVAADYVNAPVPTPCSTPQYSQTEDYALVASASAQAPITEFTADQTRTCSGTVQFTDQTQNGPSSWLWNFGDGTTSTLQNPSHRYATPGTFTVTLTTTNSVGSSSKTRTGYITYDSAVPVAATCTATTSAYCCGYGITRFALGGFVSTSADGQAGYEDFTCTGKLELLAGNRYPLSVLTGGSNPHDTRVWLDVNNNGTFEASEQIFQALNTRNPSGTYTVPVNAPLNQPLRLRVAADFVGSGFTACAGIQYGQAEDYTVTLRQSTQPPVADFTSNYVPGSCQTTVQFTDQSQNLPTSWRWNFGDGTTSTLQNPSHTYTAVGNYQVTLTATNAYGTNSFTSGTSVLVTIPCRQYCYATGDNTSFWITNVALNSGQTTVFTNTSDADPNGYGNYAGKLMTLRLGQTYTLTVASNTNTQRITTVWLDWDRNGVFDTSELVANLITTNPGVISVPVPNQQNLIGFTRMRIIARLNNNSPYSCTGIVAQPNTEIEDYSVQVVSTTATLAAQALPALSVSPNPTATGVVALHVADAGAADTYAVEVTNSVGTCVHRSTVRLSASTDASLNLSHLPPGLYVLRLAGTHGQTAIRRVLRN